MEETKVETNEGVAGENAEDAPTQDAESPEEVRIPKASGITPESVSEQPGVVVEAPDDPPPADDQLPPVDVAQPRPVEQKPAISNYEQLVCAIEARVGQPQIRREDVNRVVCHLADVLLAETGALYTLQVIAERRRRG